MKTRELTIALIGISIIIFTQLIFGHASEQTSVPEEFYPKYEGVHRTYWENGQLRWGSSYKNGLPDGAWREYDKHGVLLSEKTFKNGKLIDSKIYCDKSIQFVFVRWHKGSQELTVKDFQVADFKVGLSHEEMSLLKKAGISGELEVRGSGGVSRECQEARMIFLMYKPIDAPVDFPLPEKGDLIYVQKENSWDFYPQRIPTLDRNVRFEPYKGYPDSTLYMTEMTTGAR